MLCRLPGSVMPCPVSHIMALRRRIVETVLNLRPSWRYKHELDLIARSVLYNMESSVRILLVNSVLLMFDLMPTTVVHGVWPSHVYWFCVCCTECVDTVGGISQAFCQFSMYICELKAFRTCLAYVQLTFCQVAYGNRVPNVVLMWCY